MQRFYSVFELLFLLFQAFPFGLRVDDPVDVNLHVFDDRSGRVCQLFYIGCGGELFDTAEISNQVGVSVENVGGGLWSLCGGI